MAPCMCVVDGLTVMSSIGNRDQSGAENDNGEDGGNDPPSPPPFLQLSAGNVAFDGLVISRKSR